MGHPCRPAGRGICYLQVGEVARPPATNGLRSLPQASFHSLLTARLENRRAQHRQETAIHANVQTNWPFNCAAR